MQNKLSKLLWLAAIGSICWLGYIASQKPKIWCNREWAGVCLVKGGYRSWTMRFSDGEIFLDGKMQPVVITKNGYRIGHFSWPQFSHVDVRKFGTTK